MKILGITDTVLDHLRDQIIIGDLRPGERLNEVEIASKLSVSRAPIREAFRTLANTNFIVHEPRRGVRVADLSAESLDQLYEARKMIEIFAVDLLERKKIRELPRAWEALNAALKTKNPPLDDKQEMLKSVLNFSQFHVEIIKATKNKWIIDFYRSITFNLARYQFICFLVPGLTTNSYERHLEILHHLEEGQYDQGKTALIDHIDYTASFIREHIKGDMPVSSEQVIG